MPQMALSFSASLNYLPDDSFGPDGNLKIFGKKTVKASSFCNVATWRGENSLEDRVKQTGIKSGLHPLGQVDLSPLCLSFLDCIREDKMKGENLDELFRTSSTDSKCVRFLLLLEQSPQM